MTTMEILEQFEIPVFDDIDFPMIPGPDDYTTTDWNHWHRNGKRVFTVPPGADYRQALTKFMDSTRQWSNAWFIARNGDACPLDLEVD